VSARWIAVVALVALLGCACASHRGAVPSACASDRAAGRPPALASGWSWRIRGWRRVLREAAREHPAGSYSRPVLAVLRRGLVAAAPRLRFRLLRLRIVRAAQGAPLVIVEACSSPAAFSRQVPALARLIDPHHAAGEDWLGWDYEGFFLGAQDRHGRPFVAVFNTMRDHSGGQWARSQRLYPFAHG
jgi:hypothetical protein